jgi:hypothetical protein
VVLCLVWALAVELPCVSVISSNYTFTVNILESGINRQYFGLQKQIRSYAFGIHWAWFGIGGAFVLSWGFSCVLAWFGRDLASVGGFFV